MELIGYAGEGRTIALTGGSTDPALFSNPVIIGYDETGRPIYQAQTPSDGGGLPIGSLFDKTLPAIVAAVNEVALGWYVASHQPEPPAIEPWPQPGPLQTAGLTTETILIVAALVGIVWIASQ